VLFPVNDACTTTLFFVDFGAILGGTGWLYRWMATATRVVLISSSIL